MVNVSFITQFDALVMLFLVYAVHISYVARRVSTVWNKKSGKLNEKKEVSGANALTTKSSINYWASLENNEKNIATEGVNIGPHIHNDRVQFQIFNDEIRSHNFMEKIAALSAVNFREIPMSREILNKIREIPMKCHQKIAIRK